MSFRKILKNIYPFVLWVGLYFIMVGADYPQATWKSAVFKVLPIASLIIMVGSSPTLDLDHHAFKNRILIGLAFSLVGDVFMVWMKTMLVYGGIAFGAAHTFYISGFGFKHKGGVLGTLFSYGIFIGVLYWIVAHIPGGDADKFLAPTYLLLLCTMFWRALARFLHDATFSHACATMGGYLFIVSDFILLSDKYVGKMKDGNMWVMLTYYCAQLGIALSAATHQMTLQDPPEVTQVTPSGRRKRYTKVKATNKDKVKDKDSDTD